MLLTLLIHQREQDLDHNETAYLTIIRHFQSQLTMTDMENFEEITVKLIYRLQIDNF